MSVKTVNQAVAPLASPTFTGTVTGDVLTTTGNAALGNAAADTFKVHGAATSGAQAALVADASNEATLITLCNALKVMAINHGLMAAT